MKVRSRARDLGIIYLCSNVGVTAAVFFLPLLMKLRDISDLEIGYLAIPYSLALFVSNSIFGKLTDKFGRQKFLLVGLLSSALTTAGYFFPDTVLWFGIVRLLNGISLGMFPAAIIAIASDRDTPMGELSSWRALGWTLGAVFNGIIAELLQLEAAFILSGLLFVFAFFYAIYKDTGGEVDSSAQQKRKINAPEPKYAEVLRANWRIYLLVLLRHGTGASIWIYWTLFLQVDLKLNNIQIGVVLAINTVTQTIVMRYFGDRGDPQKMFLSGILLSGITFLLFPLTSNFLEIILTQVLLGISFAFFLVGGLRCSESRGVELNMVGTATGLFEASFSVSQLIGPILAIIIFSLFRTYTSLMYFAGIITLISGIGYALLIRNNPLIRGSIKVEP